ncbi:phosphoserine phosphatase SerB [Polynucleobacter sp. HIN6]|uniref:phosphoserine phosphatase SerB n=1 Tax=Polynucleobacter sp. HIN6 TaxID=3047865 RepID=UPI002572A626|nr:phosphoserine phosphatase SerB [Polynucleobacter sp. HIN6]BEI35348.1 phosphoserine phosphatase SerB [Polynucleobacter sp. HIN6]
MVSSSSHPFPSLQILGSKATDPQLVSGVERALQTLGIGFQHTAGRFLLMREIEAFERNGLRQYCAERGCDLAILPTGFNPSTLKVLAMDMDSTLINIECIDEIADFTGKKAAVAEITAATMRGEIPNFAESLRRRVALLEGASISALHSVYEERLQLNPGAELLISGAHERDMHTLLVSGGFTFFTDRMQERLALCETHSNQLEIVNDRLTGKVLGEIVDGAAKNRFVEAACAHFDLDKRAAIVIGDGANDLLMMADCGLSVAYRAKAIVKEKADVALDNVGLDAVLELL